MTNLTYRIFLFLLVFAPLAWGTTGQWSKTIVEGLCIFVFLLHLQNVRRGKSPFYSAPGMLPLALLAGYLLIQLVPLPPGFLRLISSKTWNLYAETIWIVRPDVWMPLSVAPKATLAEFFRLVSCGAFYLMTVQVLADRQRLKKTVSLVATFAGLFSLAAILLLLFSGGRPVETSHYWTTYANKNHYAGLMAMVLPAVLAQFLANKPQVSYSSLREKLVAFIRNPRSKPHILLGFSLVLLVAAIFLTLSRGAVLGCLGSLLVFVLLLLVRGGARKGGAFWAMFVIAMVLAVGLFGRGSISGPGHGQGVEERRLVWQDSVNIIGDFPLLGTGFGTFADIYPRYQTVQTENLVVEHAHNEYLEQMAEGGLVGTLLVGWFLLSLLRQTYPTWRLRRSRTSVYLYLGGLSGLVAILLHSFTDFALHIGAIGLYFFFFAGLAVAAATVRSRRGREYAEPAKVSPTYWRWSVIPAALVLALNLAFNAGILAGRGRFAEIVDRHEGETATAKGRLAGQRVAEQAARFDPLEPRYRYALADTALTLGDVPGGLDQFGAALRLNPVNAEYLQRLALVFDNLGQDEKAERLFRAGVENDSSDPERHKVFALWLLSEGKVEKGLEHIRLAIFWGPQKTRDFLTVMALYGLSDEEMRRILPERSVPLLAYGDYLLAAGRESAAEENYRAAIRHATREGRPDPSPFQRVAEFHAERGRHNEALEVIQVGIEIFPDNAAFRLLAAGLYERLGITYRAIEEYQRSLVLDPSNRSARERLKKLVGGGR